MKLRLQPAEMLPASPKPGTDAPHGGAAFGTAMEEMMAMPASGKPSLLPMPPVLPGKQPPRGTHPGAAKPDQVIHISAKKAQAANTVPPIRANSATVPPHATMQSEVLPGQGSPGQCNQGQSSQGPDSDANSNAPPPPGGLLPEEAKQGFDARMLPVQIPVVQELQASSQSSADAKLTDATPTKNASADAKHKKETMPDEPAHPADGQAAGILPVISQLMDAVVPIPALEPKGPASQPDGLPPASLKPSSKVVSGHVHGQNASRQAPVPATFFGHGDPPARPGYLTTPQASGTAAKGDKPPESVPSNGKSESSAKTHLTPPQPIERTNASVVVAPNQGFHPQRAPSADSTESNAKPTDIHAPKEAEKKVAPDVKSEVRFNATNPLTPTLPAPQHQSSPNISPPVTAGAEKSIATHRPDAGAAQVLQRMDLASSSGAVPLRADARRLDVGISSDTLGWVEVKATTSASGRVDATLHVQNDAAAQVLTSQSREIADYAREHSVQLGQVSVGVGTGDSAQGQSHSTGGRNGNGSRGRGTTPRPLADAEQSHHAADAVSLISIRA